MARYVISQITMSDGNVMELKDKVARDAVKGGTFFVGMTTTEIEDESSISTIIVDGQEIEAQNGMMAFAGAKEFIYSVTDHKWHEIGDNTNLGSLALKNSAVGLYVPGGSVSQPTFQGNDISYTPTGTITKPAVNVTPSTQNIKELSQDGTVTPGRAAEAELPELSVNYDSQSQNLTIGWSAGSFTPNVPTTVSLPSYKDTTVMTGVSASLDSTPEFKGNPITFTPEGTVGQPTFTGTPATITVE